MDTLAMYQFDTQFNAEGTILTGDTDGAFLCYVKFSHK